MISGTSATMSGRTTNGVDDGDEQFEQWITGPAVTVGTRRSITGPAVRGGVNYCTGDPPFPPGR